MVLREAKVEADFVTFVVKDKVSSLKRRLSLRGRGKNKKGNDYLTFVFFYWLLFALSVFACILHLHFQQSYITAALPIFAPPQTCPLSHNAKGVVLKVGMRQDTGHKCPISILLLILLKGKPTVYLLKLDTLFFLTTSVLKIFDNFNPFHTLMV